MTLQTMEKGSFFATRPVSQMSLTLFLLEVGSSIIAFLKLLFGSKYIIDKYKKSQKQKSCIFGKL